MTSADTTPQRAGFPTGRRLVLAMMAAAAFGLPVAAAAQAPQAPAPAQEQRPASPAPAPAHPPAAAPVEPGQAEPAHGQAAHGEGEHGGGHEESPLAFASRILNFVILAGGLYYVLRKPASEYLASRSQKIRGDLVTAKETTATATAQLAELDRKLQALPGELAALKARGKQEIAEEEARIRQTADSERQRLIEQTRREIDLQVRLAKRQLTEHTAALAVELAGRRIEQTITPDDQVRLVDRYVTQVRKAHD